MSEVRMWAWIVCPKGEGKCPDKEGVEQGEGCNCSTVTLFPTLKNFTGEDKIKRRAVLRY